ncbi:hypothetical protein GCM10010245_46560 [Streptomyces spectabilis]|nr:hypothetical protein GCM10010245_46560 [Streptomyces spectabilis]
MVRSGSARSGLFQPVQAGSGTEMPCSILRRGTAPQKGQAAHPGRFWDVPVRDLGFRIVKWDVGGTLCVDRGACDGAHLAQMLPCAPNPGTVILAWRISLGSPEPERSGARTGH